jgi:catechol 2,3-dioxygenase-like lactoylglutathione lyase family enzyme
MMASIFDNFTILAVEDVEYSRDFYMNIMGFEEMLRTDGWSFLKRGSLQLRIGHCPGIVPMSQCQGHSIITQANVDDANALYDEFQSNGVDVSKPEDKPWGFREFGILTPDGHRFMFVQRLGKPEQNSA